MEAKATVEVFLCSCVGRLFSLTIEKNQIQRDTYIRTHKKNLRFVIFQKYVVISNKIVLCHVM